MDELCVCVCNVSVCDHLTLGRSSWDMSSINCVFPANRRWVKLCRPIRGRDDSWLDDRSLQRETRTEDSRTFPQFSITSSNYRAILESGSIYSTIVLKYWGVFPLGPTSNYFILLYVRWKCTINSIEKYWKVTNLLFKNKILMIAIIVSYELDFN